MSNLKSVLKYKRMQLFNKDLLLFLMRGKARKCSIRGRQRRPLIERLFIPRIILLLSIFSIISTFGAIQSEECVNYRDERGNSVCLNREEIEKEFGSLEKFGDLKNRSLKNSNLDNNSGLDEFIGAEKSGIDNIKEKKRIKKQPDPFAIVMPDFRVSLTFGPHSYADASNQSVYIMRALIETRLFNNFSLYGSAIIPMTSISIAKYQYFSGNVGLNYYYFTWDSFSFFAGLDAGASSIKTQLLPTKVVPSGDIRTGVLIIGDIFHLELTASYHVANYPQAPSNFNLSGFIFEVGFGVLNY